MKAIASPISVVRGSGKALGHTAETMNAAAPSAVIVERQHLIGRRRERAALDRLLESARGGRAGVLVVHGEPGVGKTALLEYALDAGQGYRVTKTTGVEAEMELPFAALQRLCSPLIEHADRLPQRQRDALGVAFGLTAGPSANPFLVGLAVLGLFAESAEDRPVLAIVDDAQWLDGASARVLTFVARRLLAERIALLFATRELGDAFARLPELRVDSLGHRDARALLESALPAPLDDRVLERIVRELEQGELTLEKSLELFEQGVKLSRECQERLNQAERRIEILMRDNQGRATVRPFDPQSELGVAAGDEDIS